MNRAGFRHERSEVRVRTEYVQSGFTRKEGAVGAQRQGRLGKNSTGELVFAAGSHRVLTVTVDPLRCIVEGVVSRTCGTERCAADGIDWHEQIQSNQTAG